MLNCRILRIRFKKIGHVIFLCGFCFGFSIIVRISGLFARGTTSGIRAAGASIATTVGTRTGAATADSSRAAV